MIHEEFEEYIDNILSHISGEYIDLKSGDVHRDIGGYPGKDHRMPVCCDVMYSRMKGSDKVLYAPPKGKGATLTIRYFKVNH
ncbi:MAG: hypothetical protein IJL80_09530 [Treponema sp.]|nr:hypothetical protein [Treponema sp.]